MNEEYRPRGFGSFFIMPPVIKGLIIANVVVYLLQYFFLPVFSYESARLSDLFFYYGALFPIGGEQSNFQVWQLISYQFMHGGFMHLFFNLFALWMFGVELEAMWGSRKFFWFYIICGIGAGLTQLFISPLLTQVGPTIGASGAVYGILLAFGLTFPDRPIFMFPIFIPIPAKFFVLIYAGIELISGFSSTMGGVAHFAHLGGAATGFLLIFLGNKYGMFEKIDRLFSKKSKVYPRNPFQSGYDSYGSHGAKVHQTDWAYKHESQQTQASVQTNRFSVNGEEVTQSKIDEILDKISSTGYQNLTEREKLILFELSQKLK